jgi:hypothetical protein
MGSRLAQWDLRFAADFMGFHGISLGDLIVISLGVSPLKQWEYIGISPALTCQARGLEIWWI